MCLNIRIPHKKCQPFLNTHIHIIIIYCIYLNKSFLVGKQPPPMGENLEVLQNTAFFSEERRRELANLLEQQGTRRLGSSYALQKKRVLNQHEGLFGNNFLGKLIWDEVFYYGMFAEYVQIYTSIWRTWSSLRSICFEINAFTIHYVCFILPVGDSQTGVYLRQNTPEEAERWGFPRNSFYAKRLSIWITVWLIVWKFLVRHEEVEHVHNIYTYA